MRKKKINFILPVVFAIILLLPHSVAALTEAEDFLFDFGRQYYEQEDYKEALHEFNKVLILNPRHSGALKYIAIIEGRMGQETQAIEELVALEVKEREDRLEKERYAKLDKREKAIAETLEQLEKERARIITEEFRIQVCKEEPPEEEKFEVSEEEQVLEEEQVVEEEEVVEEEQVVKEERVVEEEEIPPINITGEARASLGFTPDDTVWKRANFDLNEREWRLLSEKAFDKYENTYDPAIYDQLRFNIDSDNISGLNFHANVTIDPWSFIGKSNKIDVTIQRLGIAPDDTAEFEILYWSNTGYTVNQTIYTSQWGDSFNLPEIKVTEGRILPTSLSTTFGGTFDIPELDIHKEFWPIREFWFDYKTDDKLNLRFFPMAYQDQAYTSDDPLGLSNRHIWWEESPWLARWSPGNLNTPTVLRDFRKGKWDDTLAFFTRDSDGQRLTALRGFSFDFSPFEDTSLIGVFASPKELWQEYESFDTFPGALRFKHLLSNNLNVGALYTYHFGLDRSSIDANNHVLAVDSSFQPIEGLNMSLEVATSRSRQDENSDFKTKQRGNAFYFSLIGSSTREDMLNLNYNQIKRKKDDDTFFKSRFFFAHMDDGFDPSLATYRETRNDRYWSRHIHFRKPFEFYNLGLDSNILDWEDIEPFRIGDSIDTGRDVIGLRAELALLDGRLEGLGDIRNAHYINGKYIETVSRTEWTYSITPKLTSKLLLLRHDLPKTKGGFDPFIFDPELNIFLVNDDMPDGEDPSLKTGSVGFEYRFNDFITLNGIYERTNDITLALDNFPRNVYNDSNFALYWQDGMAFRRDKPYLYGQGHFPLPPYPYFDIFKSGIQLNPREDLEIYLDWARNEFESAGQIDNNINHIGLELAYMPTEKLGFLFKYVHSSTNDIVRMNKNEGCISQDHDNFYGAFRYRISDFDQLMLEYGVGESPLLGSGTTDPYRGSLSTLDTQHIFRIYYTKDF
ncbi:MAG: hypothetical protein ISS47_09680 [Candidatus Omnitrophica bacterium]|nr:hypothetical protein [Candidatus Omnitrophota bacterium]